MIEILEYLMVLNSKLSLLLCRKPKNWKKACT